MIESWLPFLALAGRLILIGVFAFAGIAKLRDRAGTWSMLRAFGVGIRASDVLAPALPWIEIATALALVPSASARIGAIAAFALLAAFSAAIAFNLANGRTPECRCFGNVGAQPVGPATLARNVAFALLAAVAIAFPPNVTDPMAIASVRDLGLGLGAGVIGLGLIVVLQAFFMWQILQQQGRMLARIDDLESMTAMPGEREALQAGLHLPVGQTAPAFELPDLEGAMMSLQRLCSLGKPVVLFFVHPTCGPCRALVPDVTRWSRELARGQTTVVISQGTPAENREFLPDMAPAAVLLQAGHEVGDAFAAYGTPAAVVVDAHGRIASELASGADAIRALFGEQSPAVRPTNGHASPAQLAIGVEAPAFSVSTTDGAMLESSALRGSDVALVFWSPTCGYCRQAADDMVRWERTQGVRLVVLSSAPDADLVTRGFHGPLAIDDGMRVGALFGAAGTPMAVRIAADGRVASELAAGRDAIERLLQRSANPVVS